MGNTTNQTPPPAPAAEVTVESLQAALKQADAERFELQTKHATELNAMREELATKTSELKSATAQIGDYQTRLTKLEASAASERDASLKIITELKDQVIEAQSAPGNVPTFTHGKDTYELLEPSFTFKGTLVTIDELKTNAELASALIRRESSFIRLVEKKGK